MFPKLNDWMNTARALHQYVLIMGATQQYWREKEPLHLEQALQVGGEGLVARDNSGTRQARLNFQDISLELYSPQLVRTLFLTEIEPTKAFKHVLEFFEIDENEFWQGLENKGGKLEFSSDTLTLDTGTAQTYGEILYRVFTALSRVKAKFLGSQSPLVVWPHHFDLSTLWFADAMDEHKPHLNLGFAPFDSVHEEPYVYAYAYPMPDKFETLPLPQPAMWHLESWQGMWIPFAELVRLENPEQMIEDCLVATCKLLQPKSVR
jgi:hypothetical protein